MKQTDIPMQEKPDLIRDLTEMVTSVADSNNLLSLIVLATMKVMNAKASSLLLVDKKRDKLVFHTCIGEKGKEIQRFEISKNEGIVGWVAERGEAILVPDVSKDPRWSPRVSESVGLKTNTIAAAPLKMGNQVLGVLEVIDHTDDTPMTVDDLARLQTFSDLATGLLVKAREYEEVSKENRFLKETLGAKHKIIGESAAIKKALEDCAKVANSKATVLITGESGIGKELFARLVHNLSPRSAKPPVVVNCGALPETLLERELFGNEKGSFTGADSRKPGLFEAADGSTIFLDEIGETSPAMQVKLLRVLQEGTFFRIGGQTPIHVDVRVVAATNKDLEKLVEEKGFREDLFYRLNVIRIELPPLRERGEDVITLANHFLKVYSQELNQKIKGFSPEAMTALANYSWPGNVRQLENTIERACIMSDSDHIGVEDLPSEITEFRQNAIKVGSSLKNAVDAFKKEFIIKSLAFNRGNKTKTAEMLDIQRTYLSRLIKELDVE